MSIKDTKSTPAADIPIYQTCPECGHESFAWDEDSSRWICVFCGAHYDARTIAFCECCGKPQAVVDARIYDPDYNPFVCQECQEMQWKQLEAEEGQAR